MSPAVEAWSPNHWTAKKFPENQIFILSHFWKLEVCDQGVSRAMLPWKALIHSRSLSQRLEGLACCSMSPVFAWHYPYLSPNLPFLSGHQSYWIWAHPNEHLIPTLETLLPNKLTF